MRRKSLTLKPAERECGCCEQVRPIRCSEMRDGTLVDYCGECWDLTCKLRGGGLADDFSLQPSTQRPCAEYRLT